MMKTCQNLRNVMTIREKSRNHGVMIEGVISSPYRPNSIKRLEI